MDKIVLEQDRNGWMRLYVNGKLVMSTDNSDVIIRHITTLIKTDGMII